MEIIGFIILVGILAIAWKLVPKKANRPNLPKDRAGGGSGNTQPKNQK